MAKYGDPDRPDDDGTSCEDDDWYEDSEDNELVSEEARQFLTNPV